MSVFKHQQDNIKKGDVLAIYEAYRSAQRNGEDQDAQSYLRLCYEFLNELNQSGSPKHRFWLKELSLVDFRMFKSLRNIQLNKHLNVFIGVNGSGKTSLIEAIAKSISWVIATLVKEGANGQRLSDGDINNSSDSYAEVITQFCFGDRVLVDATIAKAVSGQSNSRDSSLTTLKAVGDVWRHVNAQDPINLPLFMYYSIDRFKDNTAIKKTKKNINVNETVNRFDVYSDVLNGSIAMQSFIDWFVRSEKILQGSSYGSEGSQQISSHQWLLKTITSFLSFESISLDMSSGEDVVKVVVAEDQVVAIEQLSAGQKAMIGLLGDLVSRLVRLNPRLDNPLHGQGIVLIDEIELHLHPEWQQKILLKLQEHFPNIQFIVTTHSPHVLSTVDKKCIRQLTTDEDGNIAINEPEHQTQGVCSSDVLERIMGTFSTPKIPQAEWLERYEEFILSNLYHTLEAEELYSKILEHFGEAHPEVGILKGKIQLQEFRRKVQKRKEVHSSEKTD